MSTKAISVRRRRKALAIIAGGTALGIAGMVSLAAWNDNEWIFGGAGGNGQENGVGTSSFNVQQLAWDPTGAVPTAGSFADAETRHDSNALIFNVNPSGLTPGDTIYAPVALKTDATSVEGSISLQTAVPAYTAADVEDSDAKPARAAQNDADGALWNALQYSVAVTDDADNATCDIDTFGPDADVDVIVQNAQGMGEAITTPEENLAAKGANIQYYCFAITLPNDAANQNLQGREVFPAWHFAATSK